MQILYTVRWATEYDRTLFGFSRYRMGTKKKRWPFILPYILYPLGVKQYGKVIITEVCNIFIRSNVQNSVHTWHYVSSTHQMVFPCQNNCLLHVPALDQKGHFSTMMGYKPKASPLYVWLLDTVLQTSSHMGTLEACNPSTHQGPQAGFPFCFSGIWCHTPAFLNRELTNYAQELRKFSSFYSAENSILPVDKDNMYRFWSRLHMCNLSCDPGIHVSSEGFCCSTNWYPLTFRFLALPMYVKRFCL